MLLRCADCNSLFNNDESYSESACLCLGCATTRNRWYSWSEKETKSDYVKTVTEMFKMQGIKDLVQHMARGIERFNKDIINLPIPLEPQVLKGDRLNWAEYALKEEQQEFVTASEQNNVGEAADALIDTIYFALGRLVEMGIPIRQVFDQVQEANMQKTQGELAKRPGSKGHDAVKPEGWTAPDHSWLNDPSVKEDLGKWQQVPKIIKDALKIQIRKAKDYNNGIDRDSQYYPFGDVSFYQMIHTKCMRLQSLIRKQEQTGQSAEFEGIHDTLMDLINYITFYDSYLGKKGK